MAGAYFGHITGGKSHIFAVDGEKDPVQCFEESEEAEEGDVIDQQNCACETVNIQQREKRVFPHESGTFTLRMYTILGRALSVDLLLYHRFR